MYCCKCSENDCYDFYNGETDTRIQERIERDTFYILSHSLQHAQNKKHAHILVIFSILSSNYRSKINRKISESLYTRSKKPKSNTK